MDKQTIEEMRETTGLIFEYLDQAGPRAINGQPTFFSMQTLTKDETKKMIEYYEKIKKAVEEVK